MDKRKTIILPDEAREDFLRFLSYGWLPGRIMSMLNRLHGLSLTAVEVKKLCRAQRTALPYTSAIPGVLMPRRHPGGRLFAPFGPVIWGRSCASTCKSRRCFSSVRSKT